MSLENYDTEIRPALAEFCGWTHYKTDWGGFWQTADGKIHSSRNGPDPLRNPADAWELQKAMILNDYGIDAALYGSDRVHYTTSVGYNHYQHRSEDLQEAFVLAAYDVVRHRDASAG